MKTCVVQLWLFIAMMFAGQTPVSAQFYEKLYSFTDVRASDLRSKGGYPEAELVLGRDGNFYGTTVAGGSSGYGTVFRMNPAGVMTTLVEFGPTGGRFPRAGLVQGGDGNFYGTTNAGGVSGYGTVFRMTPAGVLTTLVEFGPTGGRFPYGALVQGSDGNFYGTTLASGSDGYGTVFRITPAGTLTTLVVFSSAANGSPRAGLVQGADGNFYGTTNSGVFRMTPAGVMTPLAAFGFSGEAPYGALIQGSDGNFYGTTYAGGASAYGTVFRVTPVGVLTTLVSFGTTGCRFPRGALVQGSDGSFYGTTVANGWDGHGTVFRVTPAGVLTTLVEFGSSGPRLPRAGLVQGSDGNFYGTTSANGYDGYGTVFRMTPAGGLTTLVEFARKGVSQFGSEPQAGLVQGSDGDFYGTTLVGGTEGHGTVFKITPARELTILVEFTDKGPSNKGRLARAGLLQGSDGNFYGTTNEGGAKGLGTVFRMTPSGELATLVEFTGNDGLFKGSNLCAGMVQGRDGNFYGMTNGGGRDGMGTVFRMTPAGEFTTLVEFSGNEAPALGAHPLAGLTLGADGNFYGTTQMGGANDLGTLFRMTPQGVLTTLVEFGNTNLSNNGKFPAARLVQGRDGNFYGTTNYGGAKDAGTVFRMTPAGVLTTLVEFTGKDGPCKGENPWGSTLVESPDGNFYGTTAIGGASNCGTVFKMTQGGVLTTLVEFTDDGKPQSGLCLGADGNLYGTTAGNYDLGQSGTIYRLVFPGAPTIATTSVNVDGGGAVIQALANARGAIAGVSLEYGTDGTTFPASVPAVTGLSGYQTKLVGAAIANLIPGSRYYYRFRAVSNAGTTVTPVRSFDTLAEPVVAAAAATEVSLVSARLNGTVNARNYDATVRMEFGTDGNLFPYSVMVQPSVVTGNTSVGVSAPVAGLVKGTTYHYRVVATNKGGTAVSGTRIFRTLTEPTSVIGGSSTLTTTSVRVEGSVNAHGSASDVFFEYGTDGVSFPKSVMATPAGVGGDVATPVSAVLNGLSQGATYHYRIRATSAGGTGVSAGAAFSMNVLSGFTQVSPPPPQDAQGFLIVNFAPSGLPGGWRFDGEQQWRASGVPVAGLYTGDRVIEFRPVTGYLQPPRQTVSVVSGEAAAVVNATYYEAGAGSPTGSLTVVLQPEALADPGLPASQRAQWRLLGEDDTAWRDGDTTLTNLVPGGYLVESKPVAGRVTPRPVAVTVDANETSLATATYLLELPASGTQPSVLSFDTVSGSPDLPYGYVGQIRSDKGLSSGFVVKPRVVATAAHVVFDDGTLSYVSGLQWMFQRDRGTHEPVPQVPRGFYLFSGYAAQRATDASPGVSTPESQNLDVAALYFPEDAGRGGAAGFLASDLPTNEFLVSSKLKMLVGYPVDGIPTLRQGRMHATSPADVEFNHSFGHTYTTQDIRSGGGASGGPLCVLHDNGSWYPAAIYLGGSGQTVVRSIDSQIIELFNRAEVSGNGGDNNTSGGITQSSVTGISSSGSPGALKVFLTASDGAQVTAGWRLVPDVAWRSNGAQRNNLSPGFYKLQVAPLAGYQGPPVEMEVRITGGQLLTITYAYAPLPTPLESWRFTHFSTTGNIGVAADASDPDHDGQVNLAEYAAGTDPNKGADRFGILAVERAGGGFRVAVEGRAGRSYALERSVVPAGQRWERVTTAGPLDASARLELVDPQPLPGKGFYRVVVVVP
jgi:uncharacterized repeat protein (TIGR03803 family)